MARQDLTMQETIPMPSGSRQNVVVLSREVKEGEKGRGWAWKLKVYTGEFDGKELSIFTSGSPKAIQWGLIPFLEATGVKFDLKKDPNNPERNIGVSFDDEDPIGKNFIVSIRHKDYKPEGGTTRKVAEVDAYFKAGAEAPKPPAAGQASQGSSNMSKEEIDEIPF